MSDEAADRAAEVAAMPHVQRWAKRLRKVFEDTPPEVAVFCESGTPFVLARRTPEDAIAHDHDDLYTNGPEHRNQAGGMDQDAIVVDISKGNTVRSGGGSWDGGGW